MDDIKIIRLLSGEEILGKINKDDEYYDIKGPVVLNWMANEDKPGTPKLMIAALLPHGEGDEVRIHERHVVFEFTPMQDILNEYNAAYGSGIVVPNKAKFDSTRANLHK
tara:strand:+ start:1058 stop:1384 length:327 start_codon:yes stop_codon:yes gene_type:complete